MNAIIALIPAYNPEERLLPLVNELYTSGHFQSIVIINDGSQTDCTPIFNKLEQHARVTMLHHQHNQGKGAALKTGLRFILQAFPPDTGVVTLDADGQHLVSDAIKVAQALQKSPNHLILGTRTFKGKTPLRSRIGNFFTQKTLKYGFGLNVQDTQTGLRGLPASFLQACTQLPANNYDFELEMLLLTRRQKIPLCQVPIATIYYGNNTTSHFRPILDSLRVYWVVICFASVGLASAAIDYTLFISLLYATSAPIWLSFAASRILSMLFNYSLAKKYAFKSREKHVRAFPKYLMLVVMTGLATYLLLHIFVFDFHWPPVLAKVISEVILFTLNFITQRRFVF